MIFRFPKQKINQEVFDYESKNFLDHLVTWCLSSDYRKSVRLSSWLKEQLTTPSKELLTIADSISSYEDNDLQVIEVLKWIINNLTYKSDKNVWGVEEKWQTAEETIRLKTGDCEDGAVLTYILCRLKGVNANRLAITAGDVNGGGHCWLMYKPTEYPLNFVVLDWCYWANTLPLTNRNLFYIIDNDIIEYENYQIIKSNYYTLWFMFNEDWSTRKYTRYQKI